MANTSDYTISVVVDADPSGLASGAEEAAASIEGLGTAAASAGSDIDDGMGTAAESVGALADSTGEAADTITDSMGTAGEAAGDLASATDDAASAITTSLDAAGQSMGDLSTAASTASTDITSALSDAGTGFGDLSTDADDAADQINATMTQTIPASVQTGAVAITSKASKFKAIGTTLGTNLTAGIGEGVSGPEAAASTTSALAGLVAVTAKTGPGIIAALGFGLGVAVVQSMIKGIGESQAAFDAGVNALLDNLEGDFTRRLKSMFGELKSTLTEVNVLTDLGGEGGLAAGLEQAEQHAADLGIDLQQYVKILEGKADPVTQAIVDHWAKVGENLGPALEKSRELTDEQKTYLEIGKQTVENYDDLRGEISTSKEESIILAGLQRSLAFDSSHYAGNMERAAAAAADAAVASQTIASGIAAAARSSLGIVWSK